MMSLSNELWLELSTVVVISIALALVGVQCGRRLSTRSSSFLGASACAIMLLYALWLIDNLTMAKWLPVTNLIIWGNVQTPAMAFLSGLAWARLPGTPW